MIGSTVSSLASPSKTTTTESRAAGFAWRGRSTGESRDVSGPNPLERMAQLVRGNDQLAGELEKARGRVVRARLALDGPAGPTRLATLYLEHCKTKHRGVLAQLRANRIEADRLLGLSGEVRADLA